MHSLASNINCYTGKNIDACQCYGTILLKRKNHSITKKKKNMTDSKLCEQKSTNRLIINTNKTFEEIDSKA